ncbi:MAG: hypothetical protein GTN71_16445 [Anaerolineae bacterium]|nr:hypothetical protein [Anaerolineae bacterium]
MSEHDPSGLTIVGGRPNENSKESSAISPGLQALLQRLAKKPSLARDLVTSPEGTLAAEGLTLTPTELAMLHHLDVEDLGQPRAITRGAMHSAMPAKGMLPDTDEETRRRLAAQLELVAPFVGDPDFYMGERTRGIRPQSIYPTPFAVAEALLRTSEDFRAAFLADSQQAILTRPDLPLSDEERQMLLPQAIRERLEQVARNG